MSDKEKREKRPASLVRPIAAGKRKNLTNEVYGARLPHEDARILNDYGKANKLDRSDVVRLGLHQFALRQQLRFHKKDPLRETIEQAIAEQIAPLYRRAEETAAMINQLAGHFVQNKKISAIPASSERSWTEKTPQEFVEAINSPAHLYKEQKQLLERALMTATLALRLHVNYVVDPFLRGIEESGNDKAQEYLRVALRGRDAWSKVTRDVVERTGNRILFELNKITEEEWEELLKSYDSQAS